MEEPLRPEPEAQAWHALGAPAGLCRGCLHARVTETRRGSAFLRCLRERTDRRFLKHPPLPVLACPGFELRATDAPQ